MVPTDTEFMAYADTRTTLRPANPSTEEGLVYADLVEQAQEGAYRWMLGPAWKRSLRESWIEIGHVISEC